MQEPLLVLGRHHSLNPLDSVPSLARRCLGALALGAVFCVLGYLLVATAILVTGLVLAQIINDFPRLKLLDPLDYPVLVLLAMIPSVWIAYRVILTKSRRRADRCEFRRDSLTFVPKAKVFRSDPVVEEDLESIGNIEFVSPDRIRLDFGLQTSKRLNRIVLAVARETAEDDFERLESHLEEYAPGSLYSVTDAGEPHYSRRWDFAALFPWSTDVSLIELDLADAEANPQVLVVAGLHVFVELEDGVMLVRVAAASPGQQNPVTELVMRIDARHIRDARGMILGTHQRSAFRISMQLGTGAILEVQNDDRSVQLDGRMVGQILTQRSVMRLDLLRPQPAYLAILAFLAKRRDDLY